MIYKHCFHVEGGLYCNDLTLFYLLKRIYSIPIKSGDRRDYASARRALYRYRDKLLDCQRTLERHGFKVEL